MKKIKKFAAALSTEMLFMLYGCGQITESPELQEDAAQESVIEQTTEVEAEQATADETTASDEQEQDEEADAQDAAYERENYIFSYSIDDSDPVYYNIPDGYISGKPDTYPGELCLIRDDPDDPVSARINSISVQISTGGDTILGFEEGGEIDTKYGQTKVYWKTTYSEYRERTEIVVGNSTYSITLSIALSEDDGADEEYQGLLADILPQMFSPMENLPKYELPDLDDQQIAMDRTYNVSFNRDGNTLFGIDTEEENVTRDSGDAITYINSGMFIYIYALDEDSWFLHHYFTEDNSLFIDPVGEHGEILEMHEEEEVTTSYGTAKVYFAKEIRMNYHAQESEWEREIALLKNNGKYVLFSVKLGDGISQGYLANLLSQW